VTGNKQGFSQRQLRGAEKARELYAFCKYPSIKHFKWIVQSGHIMENDVTLADIEVAEKIWGPNIAALKGKTIRTTPPPVVQDFVEVPKDIMENNKEVTLAMDVFFVNHIPFLLTVSRNLGFTTVGHLQNKTMKCIFDAFKIVYQQYLNRGFKITLVLVDGEFVALQALIHEMNNGPRVNLTSANEDEFVLSRKGFERTDMTCHLPEFLN
jgi:hypothetical protein